MDEVNRDIDKILPIKDRLMNKVLTYYATIWKDRRSDNIHEKWLGNFTDVKNGDNEQLHALFLLTKFMYFGNLELRELLKCIYRDLFKYPIVEAIRRKNNNSKDVAFIDEMFKEELDKTRFLGIGNPSESGVHLLYYFRQENNLGKENFINTHEIFKDPCVKRFVFIDDFCGSGSQAKRYSKDIVEQIKLIDPEIEVNYLMLFGTEDGINAIKRLNKFDRVEAIFSIDKSFKCFSDVSRYFSKPTGEIEKGFCREMCEKYGRILWPQFPFGYKDGQLLLSLFHNTPNNTLPIFWQEEAGWKPIFKRFHKID